jgi:RimJ/RimL family protein N-acetyltransferase
MRIRPIAVEDAPALTRFHSRLSPDTTYLRFFSPHPRLSPEELTRFTTVDHLEREALIAELEGEIIGVARYDMLPSGEAAEVAFVVEDAWQGHGIGPELMSRLTERARASGVRHFVADTLAMNHRMLRVFRRSGMETGRSCDGTVVHVELSLDAFGGRPEQPRC